MFKIKTMLNLLKTLHGHFPLQLAALASPGLQLTRGGLSRKLRRGRGGVADAALDPARTGAASFPVRVAARCLSPPGPAGGGGRGPGCGVKGYGGGGGVAGKKEKKKHFYFLFSGFKKEN